MAHSPRIGDFYSSCLRGVDRQNASCNSVSISLGWFSLNKPGLTCATEGACNADPFLCPLSRVVAGTAVRIKRLAAPPDVVHRLRELGLGEEQQIKLLSRQPDLICLVCNARLGISSQLGEAILVQPLAG